MSSSKIDKILIADFGEVKSSSKKCSICNLCKCLKPEIKDKKYYIKKWREYLTQESLSKSKMNDPFLILTNMWAHKSVIHELEKVRINPNLIKNNKKKFAKEILIRNDLEFYIPQICSFLLFGENELIDELLAFLCKACYCSFFFAHRVLWFLKSMLIEDDNYNNNKILKIIYIIQMIYKSDSNEQKKFLKNYFIAGGKIYTDFLEKNSFENNFKINLYTKYGQCTNCENDFFINAIDENDINLNAFLANINFFDHLTKICERIRFLPSSDNMQSELVKEIIKINENLPCNIYIPFSNKEMRNYIVGHISIKDTKVFKTKERAPIILTFECFRLEEYCYEEKTKKSLKENKPKNDNSLIIKNIIKINKNKNINDAKTKIDLNKNNYLMSVDIALSKPIFVRKNSSSITNDTINQNENKFEKIEEEVYKRKFSYEDLMDKKKDAEIKQLNINLTKLNNFENYSYCSPKNEKLKNGDINIYEINSDILDSPSSSGEDNPSNGILNKKKGEFTFLENENKIKFNSEKTNSQTPSKNNKMKKNYSTIFGEAFIDQENRLKSQSEYGFLSSYKICKILIKTGVDFRQEQFASQLINEFAQIFKIEDVDCYLYPYEIISTGYNCGIIEVCPNSISLDELKHKTTFDQNNSLKNFYEFYFEKGTKKYQKALKNLVKSLAGYSLVCYFLQIKDRHNGNILINNEGYLIQIDFGFFLSNAPGNEFEKAPFKLTEEVIEAIGGINSKYFLYFRKLMSKGIIAISKHYEKIMILVEMMYCGYGKELECFKQGDVTLSKLRQRFKPKNDMKKRDYLALVDSLIHEALSSWTTNWYDKYQYFFEGIFY